MRDFNGANTKALAARFTEDAEVIEADGLRYEGRTLIEERLAETFAASPGAKMAIEVESIRLLSPDVAKEEGRTIVTPAKGGPATHRRYTALLVKRDGNWLLSSVREEPDPIGQPARPAPGSRVDARRLDRRGADSVVRVNCRWSEDGNFLIRTFTVKHQGKDVMTVTQRIGWDPATRQIRSWEFDSEGGFGEGKWGGDGDRWVIKHTATRSRRHDRLGDQYDGPGTARPGSLDVDRPLRRPRADSRRAGLCVRPGSGYRRPDAAEYPGDARRTRPESEEPTMTRKILIVALERDTCRVAFSCGSALRPRRRRRPRLRRRRWFPRAADLAAAEVSVAAYGGGWEASAAATAAAMGRFRGGYGGGYGGMSRTPSFGNLRRITAAMAAAALSVRHPALRFVHDRSRHDASTTAPRASAGGARPGAWRVAGSQAQA